MARRGCFAVVVGPDGVGKTTFAAELLRRHRSGRYFHFRPPVIARLLTLVPETPVLPKNLTPVSAPMGWLRIALAVPRFWLGYVSSVLPELQRGSLVLADRWAYGYLVQPLSLRFAGPEAMARLAIALMPKPDVIFNLRASPEVVHARKAELSQTQIRDELSAWESLPGSVVTLDASRSPDELVGEALGFVCT